MSDSISRPTTDIHNHQSPTPEVLSRDHENDSIPKTPNDVIDSRDQPPIDDVHVKAVEYLEKHNIVHLLQVMASN